MSAFLPARSRIFRPHDGLAWSPGKTPVLNVAGILILFVALWFVASGTSSEGRHLQLSVPNLGSQPPELKATSVTGTSRLGYASISGEVQNVSQLKLTNIEAVVELLDNKGAITTVDSALVGVKELGPNEVSPFTIALRDSATASSFRLRFRTLMGRCVSSTSSAP